MNAGDVARGRNHAALAATDDHWLVAQLLIVSLLDRGIKRVAVDMGD